MTKDEEIMQQINSELRQRDNNQKSATEGGNKTETENGIVQSATIPTTSGIKKDMSISDMMSNLELGKGSVDQDFVAQVKEKDRQLNEKCIDLQNKLNEQQRLLKLNQQLSKKPVQFSKLNTINEGGNGQSDKTFVSTLFDTSQSDNEGDQFNGMFQGQSFGGTDFYNRYRNKSDFEPQQVQNQFTGSNSQLNISGMKTSQSNMTQLTCDGWNRSERMYRKANPILPNSQPIFKGELKEDVLEFFFVTESNFDAFNIEAKDRMNVIKGYLRDKAYVAYKRILQIDPKIDWDKFKDKFTMQFTYTSTYKYQDKLVRLQQTGSVRK